MKRCPKCRRDYFDETLVYCLDDGARLLIGPGMAQEAPTKLLADLPSEAPTRTNAAVPEEPSVPAAGVWNKSLIIAGVVGIVLMTVLGIGSYLYYGRSEGGQVDSIAVLPFVNESDNPDAEYLSDGMTESLINSLSKIPNLSVKARSTVFRYKGQTTDPADVGRKLSVQAVLNGRVVQRGDDLTLYLSLVDTRTGDQIWGENYQRRSTDLALLQKEVIRDVSQNLRARLSGAEVGRLTKNYTDDAEAYQLYLRGRHHLVKSTRPDIFTSIKYFQQAIDRDPGYALAYVGLADAFRAPGAEIEPAEALAKSKAAVKKAIQLDDTLADAHAVMGWIIFWYEWDWDTSEAHLRRAIQLDPGNAESHLFYAHLLSSTGRHEDALLEAKRARELDPLNIRTNALEGQFLIHAGRVDEALARLQATKELDPNSWMAYLFSTSGYIEKSMYQEAINDGRRSVELNPHFSFSFLAVALAKAGRTAEARKELQSILDLSRDRWVSPYSVAMVHNALDDGEQALSWLEKGLRERDPRMVFLKVEPKWNNLRGNEHFQNILREVGFTE